MSAPDVVMVRRDQYGEMQRLALLELMVREALVPGNDWWKDLPTMAGRLIETGLVTVDVAAVMINMVKLPPGLDPDRPRSPDED